MEVEVIKSTFIPTVIKVKKSDTVRRVNTEELLHTVKGGRTPLPDSKPNAAYVKKEFEVTLDSKAGIVAGGRTKVLLRGMKALGMRNL